MTLAEYLRTHRCTARGPAAVYFEDGDFLEVHWSGELACSKPLTPNITLQRSVATGEIIGVKV